MSDRYTKFDKFIDEATYQYYNNPYTSFVFQIILAFVIGVIFSPWSKGLLWLLISIIISEILYAIGTQCKSPHYFWLTRIAVVLASFTGWIIGRSVVGYTDPFTQSQPRSTDEFIAESKRFLTDPLLS